MTMNPLDWYALTRETVPGVLLGVEVITAQPEKATLSPSSHAVDLLIGIEENHSPGGLSPCIALVASSRAVEMFAWLHTYSNESFPISQFCRVETIERWKFLVELGRLNEHFPSSVWASIVAGEMLANAEQRLELKAIPLSWASGCFSYTIARVLRIAGQRNDAIKEASTRLRTVEAESRFTRRKLTVDQLSPVWAIAASNEITDSGDIRDVVAVVLSALDHEGLALLLDNDKLLSSSAEQRIHGYDEFVDAVIASKQRSAERNPLKVGALLAGAALVAGGGTSHIELLKPYTDEYPDCLPWFGLLAGLAGPAAWDSDWLRIVKGVERQIRSGFQLTDPIQGDLCWLEFDWLRTLSKSSSVFIDLIKQHNRLLTVEIFPGATYQTRLVAPNSDVRTHQDLSEPKTGNTENRSKGAPHNKTVTESEDLILQLRAVSDQLQAVLKHLTKGNLTSSSEGQTALFSDAALGKSAKRPGGRAKKGSASS
jgi:hypothetical protein